MATLSPAACAYLDRMLNNNDLNPGKFAPEGQALINALQFVLDECTKRDDLFMAMEIAEDDERVVGLLNEAQQASLVIAREAPVLRKALMRMVQVTKRVKKRRAAIAQSVYDLGFDPCP